MVMDNERMMLEDRLAHLKVHYEKTCKEVEQLQVQLAGCSVAALGGTSEEVVAHQGQYGWSPAYQDVLNLRLKYNQLESAVDKVIVAWIRVGKIEDEFGIVSFAAGEFKDALDQKIIELQKLVGDTTNGR